MYIVSIVICLLVTNINLVNASPVITDTGGIVAGNGIEISAHSFYTEYKKKHSLDGSSDNLSANESRIATDVPVSLKFLLYENTEMDFKWTYLMLKHTKSDGTQLTANAFGDLTVWAKSQFVSNPSPLANMSLGVGVKVPTGKSIFNVGPNELSVGSGTWDLLFGWFSTEAHGPIMLHGNIKYAIRFNLNANKINNVSLDEIKVVPGNILFYDFAAELPFSSKIVLLAEVNGRIIYSGSASYTGHDGDATSNVDTMAQPQYYLQRSHTVFLTTGVEYTFSGFININVGTQVPIYVSSEYSGVTYFAGIKLRI
ncbi:MAG: transporter [Candidatus Firestonebacteria bacterium]